MGSIAYWQQDQVSESTTIRVWFFASILCSNVLCSSWWYNWLVSTTMWKIVKMKMKISEFRSILQIQCEETSLETYKAQVVNNVHRQLSSLLQTVIAIETWIKDIAAFIFVRQSMRCIICACESWMSTFVYIEHVSVHFLVWTMATE